MAWYNVFTKQNEEEKLNPIQPDIGGVSNPTREPSKLYASYYENLEVVNRGVNIIVDDEEYT